MNAEKAIQAHREWKDRLRVAMAKKETLDVSRVASDQYCKFGQWLHTECKDKLGHLPAYASCRDAHAAFHLEAAKVALVINKGQLLAAEKMLAFGTPFSKASETLTICVKSMFNEAEQEKS